MKHYTTLLIVFSTLLAFMTGCEPTGEKSFKPKVGVHAIPLVNQFNPPGADNKNLCTLNPPCSSHQHTVAQALVAHKPVLLQFASPIHCTICDGQLKTMEALKQKYGDKMVFIHVDGYKDPESVTHWGHKGDPWCYLIDRNGIIRYVLAGSSIYGEIDALVAKTIAIE